jgi:hypothetical protein
MWYNIYSINHQLYLLFTITYYDVLFTATQASTAHLIAHSTHNTPTQHIYTVNESHTSSYNFVFEQNSLLLHFNQINLFSFIPPVLSLFHSFISLPEDLLLVHRQVRRLLLLLLPPLHLHSLLGLLLEMDLPLLVFVPSRRVRILQGKLCRSLGRGNFGSFFSSGIQLL